PQSSRPDDTILPNTSPTMTLSIQFLVVISDAKLNAWRGKKQRPAADLREPHETTQYRSPCCQNSQTMRVKLLQTLP
ncbi:hypothetical protein B0T20DRAFT_356940, partial [Sordaria brevicollis]